MTDLTGKTPANTYKSLLHMPNTSTGLTASLQYVQDGDGTNSPIQVSTSAVSIDSLTVTTGLTLSGFTLSTAAIGSGTFANARISESSVTQHEAALSITESQISDLGSYLTVETNDLTAAVTWANVPDVNITESSVTQHEAAIDHDALTNFVANEHIDWTSTSSNFNTSGTAATGNLTVTGTISVTSTVDGRDIAADGTKLDTIETNADVTDAANVNAAGATMNTDTDVSSNSWVLDEDDLSSDSNTKVPTQQSVKAYVDSVPTEFIVAVSDESTDLTTGTGKVTFRMPYAMTLTDIRASVNTAPTGSTIIVDVNEGGSTILSTKLTIDASEKTSTTAATAAVISDSALADDAEITIDIDQVGSTVAGTGLKVTFIGTRA